MDNVSRRSALLRRIARLCALLMLIIVSLSAYLRLSDAGLGCTDWPQCYGASLRTASTADASPASASVAIVVVRSTHRVAATIMLLLVFTLVVFSFTPRPVLWREAWIALTLLVLVLFLAVLGRWTRDTHVPAVAMGNLLGGFAILALCWRAAGVGFTVATVQSSARTSGLGVWACVAVAVLAVQIALGALVSASFAGLSCPSLTECGTTSGWSWYALDPFRQPQFPVTTPINPDGAIAQFVHRAGAVIVTLVLLPLAIAAIRRGARLVGGTVLALLAVQIGLGVTLVTAALPLDVALAHNLVAALLLTVVASLV